MLGFSTLIQAQMLLCIKYQELFYIIQGVYEMVGRNLYKSVCPPLVTMPMEDKSNIISSDWFEPGEYINLRYCLPLISQKSSQIFLFNTKWTYFAINFARNLPVSIIRRVSDQN